MRKIRIFMVVGGCMFALVLSASAQGRKAGLWEVSSNMTWQQSPFPAGMGGANALFGGGPNTTQVCVTQEQIDKFGAPTTQTRKDCKIANVDMKDSGMTADMVCTGRMSGKGTIESTWTDGDHATGKVHFTGAVQAGSKTMPMEWTIDSTSVFKSADCGSVKPLVTSDK